MFFRSTLARFASLFVLAPLAIACGGDPPEPTPDAGPSVVDAAMCVCDDGLYCNGAETCGAGGACVVGAPPCGAGACLEGTDACDGCTTDEDGDGARSMACGGMDCDDDDADRRPGNAEVCDDDDVDEDCDPSTFGDTDADDDDVISDECCNGALCGGDCDDGRPSVSPTATEVCNAMDDDCDGSIDEGALRPHYPDADGDMFGAVGSTAVLACPGSDGRALAATDCNDADASIFPGATEMCDGVNEDCDAATDEEAGNMFYRDADGDTYGDSLTTTRSCTVPPGYVTLPGDCDDTRADSHVGADYSLTPRADGSWDVDCDGVIEEQLAPDFVVATSGAEACAMLPTVRECDHVGRTLEYMDSDARPACGRIIDRVYCIRPLFGTPECRPSGSTVMRSTVACR